MAKKMDRKLVSGQQHEIAYLARKHRVPQAIIREAHAKIGRSRARVEAYLAGRRAGDLSGRRKAVLPAGAVS